MDEISTKKIQLKCSGPLYFNQICKLGIEYNEL